MPVSHSDALLQESSVRLINLLRNDIARMFSEHRMMTLSLSGGLDSSLIAKISLEFGAFDCIVAGIKGSIDIGNARKVSSLLNLNLEVIELNEDSVMSIVRQIIKSSGITDPVTISFEIPLMAVMQESACSTICTGQGADELFGGYAKHFGLSKSEFTSVQLYDIEKLSDVTIPLENKLAHLLNKRIERPYLSSEIFSYARSIDTDLLIPKIGNKIVIRQALNHLGLEEISDIPKKAAQYGSGVSNLLKKIAKREGMHVKGLMEKISSGDG